MIYDVLINMPAETDFLSLPFPAQLAIRQLHGEWPAGIMPGTLPVNGRRVTHALTFMAFIPDEGPLALLESIITQHNLDWMVLAMQAASPDVEGNPISLRAVPASMLAYLPDLDDQGSRPTSLAGLHRYAGHPEWVVG